MYTHNVHVTGVDSISPFFLSKRNRNIQLLPLWSFTSIIVNLCHKWMYIYNTYIHKTYFEVRLRHKLRQNNYCYMYHLYYFCIHSWDIIRRLDNHGLDILHKHHISVGVLFSHLALFHCKSRCHLWRKRTNIKNYIYNNKMLPPISHIITLTNQELFSIYY